MGSSWGQGRGGLTGPPVGEVILWTRRTGTTSLNRSTPRDLIAEPYERLDSLPCVFDKVLRWAPRVRFAEHDDCRTAEPEHGFLFASVKGLVKRMNLHDTSDRQGAGLDKTNPSEVLGLEDVNASLVAEKDIRFVLQGMPIDGPEAAPRPRVLQCLSVITIVHMVIVNRCQPRQQYWAAGKGSC